ncbi:hypothetical protein OGAPHI_003549 [Ogataea philodendri]|uniref:Uncharacterized protein n=1 Tax=Ogataea philodendri TaxID=1378263 RepID=A0A9P8P7B6_9ASCO|nr:uncharacterized protein OGAPHI_003549 [Ogataea philodendri]KAH3666370.1 hypothetical protein OGAPHI_003549 [Ogataea philodendri]
MAFCHKRSLLLGAIHTSVSSELAFAGKGDSDEPKNIVFGSMDRKPTQRRKGDNHAYSKEFYDPKVSSPFAHSDNDNETQSLLQISQDDKYALGLSLGDTSERSTDDSIASGRNEISSRGAVGDLKLNTVDSAAEFSKVSPAISKNLSDYLSGESAVESIDLIGTSVESGAVLARDPVYSIWETPDLEVSAYGYQSDFGSGSSSFDSGVMVLSDNLSQHSIPRRGRISSSSKVLSSGYRLSTSKLGNDSSIVSSSCISGSSNADNQVQMHFERRQFDMEPRSNLSNLSRLIKEDGGNTDKLPAFTTEDGGSVKCLISVPKLGINISDPLVLHVRLDVTISWVIDVILEQLRKTREQVFGNQLKCELYLSDEDGEIDDDMGPLDKSRTIGSYGADEFVLDLGSEKNKFEQTSQLQLQESELARNTTRDDEVSGSLDTLKFRSSSANVNRHTNISRHIVSKPSNLEGDSYDAVLPSRPRPPVEESSTTKLVLSTTPESVNSFNSVQTKSVDTPNDFVHRDSRVHVTRRKKKFQTFLHLAGLDGGALDSVRGSEKKTVPAGDLEELGLATYHRWTVWRRQQMSVKGRYPKSLAIDGHRIYILPFNEWKGSWYESKTSSFNVDQIVKVKQNARVSHYFKIVVLKHMNEAPKTYHLEAANGNECAAIVKTLNSLMRRYHNGLKSRHQ